MLMGLVAKNAILLVDFTNKLREEGLSVIDALFEAGKERLRPILMTTIAMVYGMLPLAKFQQEQLLRTRMVWLGYYRRTY